MDSAVAADLPDLPLKNRIGSRIASHWRSMMANREDQVFLLLSLLIGALVGLVVVAMIVLTERLGMRLYPVGSAAWRRVLIPVGGSLVLGFLLVRFFPFARGTAIPQTKAAVQTRGGYISLRTVLVKFFCTAASLACGIPLGPEGPSAQIGAGVASVLGRRLGLKPEKVRALLPVGAAAAIAAAFNTPMAAVLFALEEIMGDLNAPILGSVVLASATSWMVLRLVLGNSPLFHVPRYSLVHSSEFAIYAILGIVGGVVSAAFTRFLLYLRVQFLSLPKKTVWWHPVVGGVVAGLMGWAVPQTLGVGYGYIGDALNGNMVLKIMLLLVLLKFFAVTIAYASGNVGGILGPTIFLGAMVGGSVGSIAHLLLPGHTATAGAYALVGMGALFAGIIRAPMTSVVMVFELTRDYEVIVPLMIANLLSLFIASWLQKTPIYEGLAQLEGIHLPQHGHRDEEAHGKLVAAIVEPAQETVDATETVAVAVQRLRDSMQQSWPVLRESVLVGVLKRESLEQAAVRGDGMLTIQKLLPSHEFPHVHPDHPLYVALERMSKAGLHLLPVMDRDNGNRLSGVVTMHEVLAQYGVSDSAAL